MRLIAVIPLGEGWAVRSDGLDNDMLFKGGGRAEAAARRLAEKLAGAGEPCEIRIHDRAGRLAGRFVCAPAPEPAPREGLELRL